MKPIYSLRKNYTIIGLTGSMGSGCSKLAEYLTKEKEDFFDEKLLRKPESIILKDEHNKTIYNNVLFQRKYNICYNFLQKNWKKFIFIDYKKVLFFYCFDYFINVKKSKNFTNDFATFIITTFSKAAIHDKDDFNDSNMLISDSEIQKIFDSKSINLEEFIKSIRKIGRNKDLLTLSNNLKLKQLHDQFFIGSSDFNLLFKKFLHLFTSKNYYLRTLFFHKLSYLIRETGSPEQDNPEANMGNVYNVAKLINRLIKAYKSIPENQENCQIVINSLKNSLEIMYFKERYSAFYMMAIHNESDKNITFNRIVKSTKDKKNTVKKLLALDRTEYLTNDFKKGIFSSPDIENCIQKSDIHILYQMPSSTTNNLPPQFYTLHEQLLKYLALIQQPGLITPSNIERCMQIAYNSKLNSGCISRQVGAIITNAGFAVKSIGWNDTPKKTIPCLLRNVEEVINGSFLNCDDQTYSKFELPDSKNYYKNNCLHYDEKGTSTNEKYKNKNFSNNVKNLYKPNSIELIKNEGKNYAYCFKTLHNTFEGEKNQVHTRSLHAEENAMLQISKTGGQGLENGYLFVTASPCELCSKKSYQLGIKQIYYVDRYPGIAKDHIIGVGFDAPELKQFSGVVGRSFNKLYEPFLAYKDELNIYSNV